MKYIVSTYSNGRLALRHPESSVLFSSSESAKDWARQAAQSSGEAHFVHEVQTRLAFSLKPSPVVEQEH